MTKPTSVVLALATLGCLAVAGILVGTARADSPAGESATTAPSPATQGGAPALDAEHLEKARKLMAGGIRYVLSKKEEDGSWSLGNGAFRPAITAMIVKVLAQHGDYGPAHAETTQALEAMLRSRQADGGIYDPREGSESYSSAVALMALAAVRRPQDAGATKDLIAYLKGLQIPPGATSSDANEEDPRAGGVSYGRRGGRPDLSNVGMWMQALHEGGVEANDPAMQRAAAFVTRLQNHSETNAQAWAQKADSDGGFVYVLPGGGGRGPQELRSYGSMTYTGFKSLLYAGVDRQDPRVQAALRWIQKHWRLDSNPNMPEGQSQAGLFYYYHVFAKAMAAWGEPVIVDARGVRHHWRHELIDQLASTVKEDGSWVNTADRWQESSPVLTTVFALLALEEAVRGQDGPASRPADK